MGTSPLMAIGVKAMAANYAALQTTSHNIANANVAGYSRQQVQLATALGSEATSWLPATQRAQQPMNPTLDFGLVALRRAMNGAETCTAYCRSR